MNNQYGGVDFNGNYSQNTNNQQFYNGQTQMQPNYNNNMYNVPTSGEIEKPKKKGPKILILILLLLVTCCCCCCFSITKSTVTLTMPDGSKQEFTFKELMERYENADSDTILKDLEDITGQELTDTNNNDTYETKEDTNNDINNNDYVVENENNENSTQEDNNINNVSNVVEHNFEDMAFYLNGQKITLPTTLAELENLGYYLDEDMVDYEYLSSGEEDINFVETSDKELYFSIYQKNDTSDEIDIRNCPIYGVGVEVYDYGYDSELVDFELTNGLNLEELTLVDFDALYPNPTYKYDDEGYATREFYKNNNEYCYTRYVYTFMDGILYEVEVELDIQ